MKTLYLYGPPASGKSTLAKELARDYGVDALDLDELIVRRTGMDIPRIFAVRGEAEFRRIESETLREAQASVIALGGGTLLREENRAFAEKNGFVAVIDADEETIAKRIEAAQGTRPLGNRFAERKAHYASFAHRIDGDTRVILPGRLTGRVRVNSSKSHIHRLLIAEFLAGAAATQSGVPDPAAPACGECEDISATRRCIAALSEAKRAGCANAVLDCGESGSTLRFMAPVAAALGISAEFVCRGRLAQRPMMDFSNLASGEHVLRGDVSSQFATGLLFALPLLPGDSRIRFSTPLQSRGYVDMTLDVIRDFGIEVEETEDGFLIAGSQRYTMPGDGAKLEPEGDWSSAAFWFAANALGHEIEIEGLKERSRQPDSAIASLIETIHAGGRVDVSGCPDNYPALAVVNHALGANAVFTGTERLRLKESDRLAAMEAVFASPHDVDSRGDHRIAMAAAILAASSGEGPSLVHGASSVAKSYPAFWQDFASLHNQSHGCKTCRENGKISGV